MVFRDSVWVLEALGCLSSRNQPKDPLRASAALGSRASSHSDAETQRREAARPWAPAAVRLCGTSQGPGLVSTASLGVFTGQGTHGGRVTKAPGAQGRGSTETTSRRPLEVRAGGARRPGHEGPWSSGQVKSHRWRSLVGCSSQGRKESGTTERLHFHF